MENLSVNKTMARIEKPIMAEGTSAGAEGGNPVNPGVVNNTENQNQAQPERSGNRWEFLKKLRRPGHKLEVKATHTSQALVQSGEVDNQTFAPPKHTLEQLLKIPASSRFSFLRALPEAEQLKAMHILGLEMRGGSGPAWMSELDPALNQPSKFQETLQLYEQLTEANLHRGKIPPARLADFDQLLADTAKAMDDLVRNASLSPVMAYAIEEMKQKYAEAIQIPPKAADEDSYYPTQSTAKTKDERLAQVKKALGREEIRDPKTGKIRPGEFHYQEAFWEYGEEVLMEKFGLSAAQVQKLRQDYEGIASYIASKVAIAIEKEFKGISLNPDAPGFENVGDVYLDYIHQEVRQEQEKEAQRITRERRRAHFRERLKYNHWSRRFDFLWAQNAAELEESVLDWLEYFQQQLPQESAGKVNQSIQTGRENALGALEYALHRLEIPTGSETAEKLRATIEGHVDVIGGVQLLESQGGFEAYTEYLEDFSNNFNAHHDAVYLRNPKAAIIHDFLSDGDICLGGPDTLEKPLDGETKAFRMDLEERAKVYGATHELYIREEDFMAAELGRAEVIRDVQQLNLTPEQADAEVQRRLAEKLGRYGWNDKIEEMLIDSKNQILDNQDQFTPTALQTYNQATLDKFKTRIVVFRKIKRRLDAEDIYEITPGHFVSLATLTPDQRKDAIRKRIWDEMAKYGNKGAMVRINAMGTQAEKDRALWKWVKDRNVLRERNGLDKWFPSSWDTVRLSINTSTKLIDRALSKQEFRSMIEEVDDPYAGLTEDETRERMLEEFRAGLRLQFAGQNLTPDQLEERVEQEMAQREEAIHMNIEDVIFDREKRRVEAERAFNVDRAYQKFLGLDARWGGLTVRVVDTDGKTKLRTIPSLKRDILKAKIDKEEAEIEAKVNQFALTLPPNLTPEQIDTAKTRKRRLFRKDATFAVALGLREKDIGGDIPGTHYFYYGDPAIIQVFTELVGLTHNDKGLLPELLDRQRREEEAVDSFLAEQFMEKHGGETLVVIDDPLTGEHREFWERSRVINEGGELSQRDLFESRFMISTSGAVKVADLISRIADLGVKDLLSENGCWDMREFQGYIKRRDEVELKKQSFWNIRKWADPIRYAQRLRGAAEARKFLVGGEIKGQGNIPGVLNEPFNGLWRFRDEFLEFSGWISANLHAITEGKGGIPKFNSKQDWINFLNSDQVNKQINTNTPEKVKHFRSWVLEILSHEEVGDYLKTVHKDKMVPVGAEILKFLTSYMDARRYVMNRAGFAPKNWQWDNEIMLRAFLSVTTETQPIIAKAGDYNKEASEKEGRPVFYSGGEEIAKTGGEMVGGDHLAYAPEGRTIVAINIFKAILSGSSYHTLDAADVRTLEGRAYRTKEAMATKRAEIVQRPLPQEIQTMLANREAYLLTLHTSDVNRVKEAQRIKDQYYDTQLQKEFIGEWPIRLLEAA